MNNRIAKYLEFIKLYPSLPVSLRKRVTKNLDEGMIHCICEICLNIVKGNVPMTESYKKHLRKYKVLIRSLAKRGAGATHRKKLVNQSGGGFLPLLFSVVAPLIAGLVQR